MTNTTNESTVSITRWSIGLARAVEIVQDADANADSVLVCDDSGAEYRRAMSDIVPAFRPGTLVWSTEDGSAAVVAERLHWGVRLWVSPDRMQGCAWGDIARWEEGSSLAFGALVQHLWQARIDTAEAGRLAVATRMADFEEWKANAIQKAHAYADDASLCDGFDQFMEDIGLPGRERDFVVEVTASVPVSITVSARSAALAMDQVDHAMVERRIADMDSYTIGVSGFEVDGAERDQD